MGCNQSKIEWPPILPVKNIPALEESEVHAICKSWLSLYYSAEGMGEINNILYNVFLKLFEKHPIILMYFSIDNDNTNDNSPITYQQQPLILKQKVQKQLSICQPPERSLLLNSQPASLLPSSKPQTVVPCETPNGSTYNNGTTTFDWRRHIRMMTKVLHATIMSLKTPREAHRLMLQLARRHRRVAPRIKATYFQDILMILEDDLSAALGEKHYKEKAQIGFRKFFITLLGYFLADDDEKKLPCDECVTCTTTI